MRSFWVRLGVALLAGPPLGLLTFFVVGEIDYRLHNTPDPNISGPPFAFSGLLSMLLIAYVWGLVPALVGGIGAAWITTSVRSRLIRLFLSGLIGAATAGAFFGLFGLGFGLEAVERVALRFGLIGLVAARGSALLAEFIEFVNTIGATPAPAK